jgi:adenylate kinase
MGPPGVGKGTQADRIKDILKIIHLSTGEILREEIRINSDIGIKAKMYMDDGMLVPDSILLQIVQQKITQPICQNGYLLDGFPRTIPQANGLEKIMITLGHKLDYAISLNADTDELIERLIKRGKESGRNDDTPEVIRNRQKIYWQQTAPLLEYYGKKGILKDVDGLGTISEITNRILEITK